MFKNVAGQKLTVYVFDPSTGLPETGDAANLTAYVSLDDGTVTVLTDTSAAEKDATNAAGYYTFDLSQAETNADKLDFSGKSSTSGLVVVASPPTVYTRPANFSTFAIDGSGRVDVGELGGDAQSLTDLKDFADAGYDPSTNKVEGVKLADATTTVTNEQRTIYLDPATGNDSNPGTKELPKDTFAGAIAIATPGDRILLMSDLSGELCVVTVDDLTIEGVSPNTTITASTTISDTVVTVDDGTTLRNLTITPTDSGDGGGEGIKCINKSRITLENLTVNGKRRALLATYSGSRQMGGIYGRRCKFLGKAHCVGINGGAHRFEDCSVHNEGGFDDGMGGILNHSAWGVSGFSGFGAECVFSNCVGSVHLGEDAVVGSEVGVPLQSIVAFAVYDYGIIRLENCKAEAFNEHEDFVGTVTGVLSSGGAMAYGEGVHVRTDAGDGTPESVRDLRANADWHGHLDVMGLIRMRGCYYDAAKIEGDCHIVDDDVAATLVDTGTTIPGLIGTPSVTLADDIAGIEAGSGLDAAGVRAAIGLASANLDTQLAGLPTDGDVQTAAAAALSSYDPPTKAELDAAVSPLATSAALATVDSNVDAILVDTGTTLDGKLNTIDGIVDDILTDTGTTLPATLGTPSTSIAADIAGLSLGANPNVLLTAEIATVNSQTSFTLASGADFDDAYNGQTIVLYDDSNSDFPSVRVISDYVGSTKTVTIDSAPAFTLGTDDSVAIFATAPGTTAPTAETVATAVRSELTTELGRIDAAVSTRSTLDAAGVRTAVGLGSANLDTQLAGLPTDSDVQTAAAAALSSYDPPTKAELDAAVSPLATSAALETVDGNVDSILVDTGTTIPGILGTPADTIAADIAGIEAGSGLDAAGVRAAIGMAAANLDDQIAALPTAAENATQLLATATSDAGAGTIGRLWHYALAGYSASGELTAGMFANQPAAEVELTEQDKVDIAQETTDLLLAEGIAVPPDTRDLGPVQHTWQLKRSGDNTLRSTNPWYVTKGDGEGTGIRGGWNCDIPSILPPGTVIATQADPPELVTASDDITITHIGHGEKVAKVQIAIADDAEPGSHWIKTQVTNSNNGGPVTVYGEVVIQAEPE